jgi:lipoprotein-releasing system permease protein
MSTQFFEFFVAARYLRAKRKQAVISVITVISIIGVAAGAMALVIGLAINNGFRSTLQRSLLGATAHVMLLEKEPTEGISNWAELVPPLRKIPHVVNASPVLYGTVLLAGPLGGGQAAGAEMKGIPVDSPPEMLLHLKQGTFEDLKNTNGLPGIILGASLARNTGMMLHSVVNIIPPQGELTPFGPKLVSYKFRVVGIFESGFYEVDALLAFTALKPAQQVFSVENVVNTIELRLDDIYEAPQVAKAAEPMAGPKLATTTRMGKFHQIVGAVPKDKVLTALNI